MKRAACLLLLVLCLSFGAMADEKILPYEDKETGEQFLFLPSYMAETQKDGMTVMHGSTLPVIFIDTVSGSMERVHADKNDREQAVFRLYGADGMLLMADDLEYIKGHGNATWQAEKKSYQIKFQSKEDLFKMGKAKKWLLMANAQDGSFLRNKLVYDAALSLNIPYAVESEFVDVYLNGEYAGNYLLTEKVEEGNARVVLANDSYLVEVENHPDAEDITFETEWGTVFRVHYPEDGETAFIQEKTQALEDAFVNMEGYMDLIEPETFARKAVLDEIAKNNDGFEGSTYFYLTRENGWRFNGDLFWDYDSTFGNWGYRNGYYSNPMGLILPDLSIWYETLCLDEEFMALMQEQYLRIKPIFLEYTESTIDKWETVLSASWQMDYARYKGEFTLTKSSDFKGQLEALKTFIVARLEFLDSGITDGVEYVSVFLDKGERESRYIWVPSGTLLKDIEPGMKWVFDGSKELLADDLELTFSCMIKEAE
jgi:Spore coat assembly protein